MGRLTENANEFVKVGLNLTDRVITLSPRKEDSQSSEFITRFTLELPGEFAHCKSPEQVLLYSHHKQIPLVATVVKSDTRIGQHVIEHYEAPARHRATLMEFVFTTSGEIIIHDRPTSGEATEKVIEIPPVPFPPAVSVYIESGVRTFQTALRIKEIDTAHELPTIILTNEEHASCMCDVTLVTALSPDHDGNQPASRGFSCSINMKVREQSSVYESLLFWEFMLEHARTGEMVLRDQRDGKALIQHNQGAAPEEQIRGWERFVRFLRDVQEIEQAFSMRFDSVPDIHDRDTRENVGVLIQILRFGKIDSTVEAIESTITDRESLRGIVENLSMERKIQASEKDCTLTIQDKIFQLGDRITFYPPVSLKDRDRAIRRLEDFEKGDVVKIELIPSDNNTAVQVFPKFYGTDDYLEIAARENWGL